MEETDTQITWPSKLKIGAKSKKGKLVVASPQIRQIFQKKAFLAKVDTNVHSATMGKISCTLIE